MIPKRGQWKNKRRQIYCISCSKKLVDYQAKVHGGTLKRNSYYCIDCANKPENNYQIWTTK